MFRKSINRKLMILFFAVGVSSLAVIGVYSYYNSKEAILKRTLDQLTSIRVIKKGQVEFYFNERFNNIQLLSEKDYLKNLTKEVSQEKSSTKKWRVAENLNFNLLGFQNAYLITQSQNNLVEFFAFKADSLARFTPDSVLKKQLSNIWAKSTASNNPSIVDFEKRFPSDTLPICLIGKSIDIPAYKAVLALQVPISAINDIMLEINPENGLGESGEVYLVGDDSLMRSKSRFIQNSVLNTQVHTQSVRNAFKDKYGSSLIDDYRTISCLSSFDRVKTPGLNWVILAEIDYAEAMIPIISIRNDIVFLSLIICVFLFSISHFISRTITNPIIKLKKASQKIGEGDLDVSVTPKSNDEIGLLTDAFNSMVKQLKDERLQRMTALYDGQEMERQRISRELHDGLGQKMVAIKLQLESLSKHKQDDVPERIKEIKENFLRIIDEVRQISNNLAPNILNESGLDVALKSLCTSMASTTDIDIEISAYGDYATADSKVKFYIYRIAQEAVNNAIKHSGANRIQLQLMGNKDNIILVLEDNGKGFNYSNNFCTPCNGIYNMKERAKLIGATFDIETEPNAGTTIRLKVPKSK